MSRIGFLLLSSLLVGAGLADPEVSLAAGAEQPARSVRVVTSLAPTVDAETVEARLLVTTATGEERSVPLRVPGEAGVRVPDSGARLHVEAPGFWSRTVSDPRGEVSLRLHASALLEGRVSVPGRSEPPDSLRVVFRGPNLQAPVRLPCPIDEQRAFACVGPAGTFDLRIRAAGFAPHFLWDVEVASGRPNRLQPLSLEPGASVTGFVERSDGTLPGPKAVVRLVPQVVRQPGSREGDQEKPLSTLERKTRPGERGFFVFADVAPGRYVLEVEEPGWSPGRLDGVEVSEGDETRLRTPILLDEPVTLQVQLSPATAPSGKRWRLQIRGQHVSNVPGGGVETCDPQGFAAFSALPADTYMLVAVDPGNGQPFEKRIVEVAPPLAFVDWELPLVAIEGTVRLGREPLPSDVTFGPTQMAGRSFEADEEGDFAGVLSRSGEWEVLVESPEDHVSRFLRGVEVPEPSEPGESVRVALDLPGTELGGLVVDEDHRPIQAQVIFQPLAERDRANGVRSDPRGSFTIRGLPPGRVELFAMKGEDRTSPVTAVDLAPDAEVGPIRLQLERKRTVRGSLRGPDGPVRGARIAVRGTGSGLHSSTTATATTDARGAFSLEVPSSVQQAHLAVRAPGHPFTVRRIRVGESLHLRLEQSWGSADVDWDPALVARLWMAKDGASWKFSSFVSWAAAHPGEGKAVAGHTVIPKLESGVWHVCAPEAGTTEWLRLKALGVPGATCKRLEITAWGTASAALRADDEQEREE